MKILLISFVLSLNISFLVAQNSAIQFDGNSENLVISHKPAFDLKDSGTTIEAWIFANRWTTESWRGSIFANDAHGTGLERGYSFRCGNNGTLSFVSAINNKWTEVATTPIMNTKQWHHVAVTIGNNTMTLYIDGQAISSTTYQGSVSPNDTHDVFIGKSAGFDGRYFDGIIDEVRVWDVARTESEIAANITTSFTGTEAGLVAYFPMNEGSGLTTTNLVDAACSASGEGTDDSNWVDGFSLPEFDLSVKDISGIDRVNMKTRPVKVTVGVQNVGLNTINNYNLILFVNGNEVADEVADLELAAGDAGVYTFQTPIDLSDKTDIELKVELSHPDDANALNNTSAATVLNKNGMVVNLFNKEVHNFGGAGQNQSTSVILPGDLSGFEKILLHIDLDCPVGGCDPWDQTAKVILNTDLGALEIARYITPYGIACGPWTVDITDFSSVLGGENSFTSFVSVFGPNGWAVTLDLEFIDGNNNRSYSKLTPLWADDNQVYGDPDISHDLPELPISVAANTESNHVRMHVTGHGQGNTSNAAEFHNVTHQLLLDGNNIADHHLWKDDCATNSCTNQLGNYLFARAGWCPGQEVIPAIFETTNYLSSGSSAGIDYKLQDYTNLLNTGYNNSGHTEPHYRLHGFFVENSSTPYRSYTNLVAEQIEVRGLVEAIRLRITNNGTEPVNGFAAAYYLDGALVVTENVSAELQPGEAMGRFDLYGEVIADIDETPGDNLIKTFIDLGDATLDLSLLDKISVFPNPSTGNIVLEVDDKLIGGQLEISSIEGKQILGQEILELKTSIDNLNAGTLILKVIDTDGNFASKKIVVLD